MPKDITDVGPDAEVVKLSDIDGHLHGGMMTEIA
jgi:hypothetical protein